MCPTTREAVVVGDAWRAVVDGRLKDSAIGLRGTFVATSWEVLATWGAKEDTVEDTVKKTKATREVDRTKIPVMAN